MRKFYSIVMVGIISFLFVSCSNLPASSKINTNSVKLSSRSEEIIKNLGPSKNIDDFYEICTVLDRIEKDSKRQLIKDMDYLVEKNYEYDIYKKDSFKIRVDNYKEGRIKNIESVLPTDKEKMRKLKEFYWGYLIVPLYAEKNSYEYPVDVDVDSLISDAKSDGYIYKIEGNSRFEKFISCYEDVEKDSKGEEKGKGDHITIVTDLHENIISIRTPKIKESDIELEQFLEQLNEYQNKSQEEKAEITLNNLLKNLKEVDFKNNRYLIEILTSEELQKLSDFCKFVDLDTLKDNVTLKDGFFTIYLNVGDKYIISSGYFDNIGSIYISSKDEELSKYLKDIKWLENESMTGENFTKKIDYKKVIDIDKYIQTKQSKEPLRDNKVNKSDSNTVSNRITQEQAMQILNSKIKIKDGNYLEYESIRNVNGKEYYLYIVCDGFCSVEAYCVDVYTRKVFKCSDTMELTPIE